MLKMIRAAMVCAGLLLVSSALFAAVYPTVDFSFNQNTWEYSWTISCPADSTYPFGQFTVDAMLPGGWTSHSGPVVNGTDMGWEFVSSGVRSDGNRSFWWRSSVEQEVLTGNAWTGIFTVIVPDSTPVAGKVQTKDGAIGSMHTITNYVPGPIVPEPSGLALLGTSLVGLVPFVLRRRN